MLPISFAGTRNVPLARKYGFPSLHHSLWERSKNQVIFLFSEGRKEVLVPVHRSSLGPPGQRVEEMGHVAEAVDRCGLTAFPVTAAAVSSLCWTDRPLSLCKEMHRRQCFTLG